MRPLILPGKVAEYLALVGEAHKYKIAKDLKLHPSRVNEGMKRLEKLKLVKSREIGKARTGLPMRGYSLTLEGIAAVLTHRHKLWDKIDIIAEKNRGLLPLIFGKWDFFKKLEVILELATDSLKVAFFGLSFAISFSDMKRRTNPLSDKDNKKMVYERVIWPFELILLKDLDKKMARKWKEVIASDPKLNAFVQNLIKKKEETQRRIMEEIKADKLILKGRKED